MCGIAGILAFEEEPGTAARLRGMLSAMRHRGPDDEGMALFRRGNEEVDVFGGDDTPEAVFASRTPYSPERVYSLSGVSDVLLALGHRRLSILDLSSAGHQPMATGDRRYWIAYNGEVYNYREIRTELEQHGESFRSNTDTEVILKSYRKWGPECLSRFNGMFAFAIWDNREKQLFCARDRIGIKPFYFFRTDRLFLFASDIKTIIASGVYRPEVDMEGLYHALSFDCAPRPLTCFQGVRALPQAHWMMITCAGVQTPRRYWALPPHSPVPVKPRDWCAELEAQLKASVQRRLIADVPVGTFMSGGIDSTTVSALASGFHPGIQAFTLGFGAEGDRLDEVEQAKATAQLHPMQHLVKIVTVEETIRHLDDQVLCNEEPSCIPNPTHVMSQFVREHDVPVVLNGLGGDELFCGYGRERVAQQWRRLLPWRHVLGLLPHVHESLKKRKRISALRDLIDCYVYTFSIFLDHDKQRLFGNLARGFNTYDYFREHTPLSDRNMDDPIDTMCTCDLLNYIGNHQVYRTDQFTMWFSLEARFPFLDHELVELAFQMPSEVKVAEGAGKFILRQMAMNYIAPACLDMQKKGFSMPVGEWIGGAMKPLVTDKLSRLGKRNLFSALAVDDIVSKYHKRRRSSLQVWLLVSLEMWLERFIDGYRDLHAELTRSKSNHAPAIHEHR